MKHLAIVTLVAGLGLAGCNLSEAERMDLNRREVGSIACSTPRLLYGGADSMPATSLYRILHATNAEELRKPFDLQWEDRGTQASSQDWTASVSTLLGSRRWFRLHYGISAGWDYFRLFRHFCGPESVVFTASVAWL